MLKRFGLSAVPPSFPSLFFELEVDRPLWISPALKNPALRVLPASSFLYALIVETERFLGFDFFLIFSHNEQYTNGSVSSPWKTALLLSSPSPSFHSKIAFPSSLW